MNTANLLSIIATYSNTTVNILMTCQQTGAWNTLVTFIKKCSLELTQKTKCPQKNLTCAQLYNYKANWHSTGVKFNIQGFGAFAGSARNNY